MFIPYRAGEVSQLGEIVREDFMDEYDYERMTRLLLEYHHDEIKGKLLVK